MAAFIELMLAGLVSGLVIGLGALAVTLVFGIARFANAATGDMMTVGAYGTLAGTGATGSLLVGGLTGLAAGALAGVLSWALVFRPLERRSAVSALIASIGVGFVIRAILGLVYGHGQKVFQLPLMRPWRIEGVRVHPYDLALGGVAAATLLVVFLVLGFTPIGRRMRAVADDPDLARICGIPSRRVMLALWTMAGGVCAIAGTLLGVKTVVSPEMGWDMLLPAFAAAIFGGLGHPVGAVVAGLLLGLVQETATPLVGFTYKIALAFVVLLAVLLVRPRGLFGTVEGVR